MATASSRADTLEYLSPVRLGLIGSGNIWRSVYRPISPVATDLDPSRLHPRKIRFGMHGKLLESPECAQRWSSTLKNRAHVVMFTRIWPPAKSSVNNAG
jgi:hypothetical protein